MIDDVDTFGADHQYYNVKKEMRLPPSSTETHNTLSAQTERLSPSDEHVSQSSYEEIHSSSSSVDPAVIHHADVIPAPALDGIDALPGVSASAVDKPYAALDPATLVVNPPPTVYTRLGQNQRR